MASSIGRFAKMGLEHVGGAKKVLSNSKLSKSAQASERAKTTSPAHQKIKNADKVGLRYLKAADATIRSVGPMGTAMPGAIGGGLVGGGIGLYSEDQSVLGSAMVGAGIGAGAGAAWGAHRVAGINKAGGTEALAREIRKLQWDAHDSAKKGIGTKFISRNRGHRARTREKHLARNQTTEKGSVMDKLLHGW